MFNTVNENKPSPRYITVRLQNFRDKEKVPKASRNRSHSEKSRSQNGIRLLNSRTKGSRPSKGLKREKWFIT